MKLVCLIPFTCALLGLPWEAFVRRRAGKGVCRFNSAVFQPRLLVPLLKLERSTDHDALSKQHVKIKDKSSRCSHPDLVVGCILSHIVSVWAVFGAEKGRQ